MRYIFNKDINYLIKKFGKLAYIEKSGKRVPLKMIITKLDSKSEQAEPTEVGIVQNIYFSAISKCGEQQPKDGDIIIFGKDRLNVVSAITYEIGGEPFYRKTLMVKRGMDCERNR